MEAWHYDGLVARRRHPRVRADADGLYLSEGDWAEGPIPWDALVTRDRNAQGWLLGRRDRDGWRLGLEGDVPADLAARLPQPVRYGGFIDRIGLMPAAIACAGVAAIVVAVGMAAPGWVAKAVPMSWERRIGTAMIGDFGGRLCDGPGGQAALDRLVRRIEPAGEPLDVRVAAVPMVNAAALPGGRIVIFEKLLTEASGPDEVAGVLAHEIGHVRHRDVLSAMARQAGIGLLLASFTGDVGNALGTLIAARYSRGAESAADGYAIAALATNGISPLPTARFFRKLAAMEEKLPQTALGYLSSHPLSKERRARFEASARTHRGDTPALTDADWQTLRRICTTDKAVVRGRLPF
ncbi:M48 family metallopeptidase [Sphingomonas donggukensis]|uniref:M48 family metallopeptidase n=1 Tax=Sphingomonas donggukensis TaxID=2949093 RepID=A0ABY4TU42_9SPHN|nr:M48 family metallopeptidase [Sphingomonas donggukensis]URW74689.1 M48 family metallopeptidase [Sphingomonas donggukensis]